MKSLHVIILSLLLLPVMGYCQQTAPAVSITATIMDSSTNKPLAYATVNLLDATHNIIASGYSLENGNIALKAPINGNGILEVTAVGYSLVQLPVQIPAGQTTISIGQVKVQPSTGTLQDVTVTARKKLVEQRPGMLVYNAENDLSNKGGTAADVLRKAPVLNVDAQGNVSMRGSSNLKILVNGKYSGQMARSPADALNMMSADNVKTVEVITNPSAKYDAEGAAGVINIITKKGRKDFNGTIEASGSNYAQMINPRFSYGTGKWDLNITGHIHRLRQKDGYTLERVQLENSQPSLIINQEKESDNIAPHGSADMSVVYTADSMNELSFGLVSWVGKWPDNNTIGATTSLPNGQIQEQYLQSTQAADHFLGGDFNIGYNRKFTKPGRELNLLVQFSPSRSRSEYQFKQEDNDKALLYAETNNGLALNKEWTVQADYIHPLTAGGKHSLEAGFKIITRNVTNEYAVEASEDDPAILVPQPARTDEFTYGQDVYAGYALLKLNLQNDWYVETGARLELTNINGSFRDNGNPFTNNFTNFIPTATVSKKINASNTISMSYTKRLTRPYIWDLNPNADASDPKNISTGNPELQPEIAHQAEITYSINGGDKYFINTAVFWRQTDNAMVDFTATNSNGISVTSKQNLAANKQYGANISYVFALAKRLSLNGNINPGYLDYSSGALQVFNEGWAFDADLNLTWKLPANYTMQVFGEYSSRKVTLQGYETNTFFYNLAAKKAIPSKKITLTASFINPFSNYIPQTNVIQAASFNSTQYNRYYGREFKLTLGWEFGASFAQKEKKKVTNDDINDKGKG